MKVLNPLILTFLLLVSCNLQEKLERARQMNDDLETHFNHDEMHLVFGWGTEEGDDNIQVTFYEYDISSKQHSELRQIAGKVADRLTTKYPRLQRLDFIEVRFTEEKKKEENSSFVTFKHSNF